jgi:orotate phosphoribosyltransferase
MVSIFNYEFNEAVQNFDAAGVGLRSLTNYSALLRVAIARQLIAPEVEPLLQEWRNNPAAWGK